MPQSVLSFKKGYRKQDFLRDLTAGLTVGSVALPLAMAFAVASGVPPQAGLYCAVIAGFLISLLGGSRLQIGGPTGAFVVIVAGIVARYGLDGLLLCTIMAGGMLIFLGVTGLGAAVKFLPRPVVVGFTNGIAVFIASTQIRDFLGLQLTSVPGDFVGRINVTLQNLGTLSFYETGVGGARPQPARLMHQAEFERHVGRNNICNHIKEALARAAELHDPVSTAVFNHTQNFKN